MKVKKTRTVSGAFFSIILSLLVIIISCDYTPSERSTILEPIQPIHSADTATSAIGGGSDQMLAQIFTIERDGELTGIYLPIGCADGILEIEIRNVESDEPGSTIHSTQTFNAGDVVSDVSVFELFRITSRAVVAGDRLAFVLKNESGSCGMARGPEGDSYTGGEAYFDARPNAPGWNPLTIGTGIHDLPFHIVLELE